MRFFVFFSNFMKVKLNPDSSYIRLVWHADVTEIKLYSYIRVGCQITEYLNLGGLLNKLLRMGF